MLQPRMNRFEDRMNGILSSQQIQAKDSAAAAHRFFIEGNVRFRSTDSMDFCKKVKEKVRALLATDIDNHALCRHLKKDQASPLVEEAFYWDIQVPKNQPQFTEGAAQAIFETYEMLNNLPPEAHKILFPLYFEGHSLGHAIRVGIYASLLAQKLNTSAETGISPELAAEAGFLHDLGKLEDQISSIIKKPVKLSKKEYELVKFHPIFGRLILNELETKNYIYLDEKRHEMIYNGMLDHHVRPDGNGYPTHIISQSLIGKILAVADSFDAMTSNRDYAKKKEDPIQYAHKELKRCSGTQFDPEMARLFIEINPSPTFRQPNLPS